MASKKPGKNSVVLLTLAALCTAAEGFVYASVESAAPLVAAGHAEQNPTMTNDAAELATRATDAGRAAYAAELAAQSNTPTNTPAVPVPTFAISKGIPIPARTRTGGGRESIYPWGALEVGDSFFVPGKETNKFGSTLATGRKQFHDAEGNKTRDFKAANVTENGIAGLRVWRTV